MGDLSDGLQAVAGEGPDPRGQRHDQLQPGVDLLLADPRSQVGTLAFQIGTEVEAVERLLSSHGRDLGGSEGYEGAQEQCAVTMFSHVGALIER